ncbi:tyrosine-type recombinase/integrase [Kitasatospora sp. LaBMicrA B282]|uniref:tyrosine-type recombinase/integrase n=1 Tax=Kitasatospora sp. LaBMicrA B282 TaxID=3420949 RepID=UPI003D122644
MRSLDEAERDLAAIRLPKWGRVVPAEGVVPWLVVAPDGTPVVPVRRYLHDFVARNRPGSVRSYAYALLRWWRWLLVVDVEWSRATSAEVRDLVLWLRQTSKPRNSPRTRSAATAGTVNPITRKRNLNDQYQPRTIRHSNAVIRSFYEFWIETGHGPLVNPVPLDRRGGRPNAHHNPLEPFRPEGRIRYNPKVPKNKPREIPDERWNAIFGALRSNRDRALLSLDISNAARASELLGIRSVDLDWGDQLVRVSRKGSDDLQWLPASPDAFVWLRLYLAELGPLEPNDPVWWTLRRRDRGDGLRRQPMNYEALRAVFRRINAVLATNYTMHDLRHTAALRMSRDRNLTLLDVQTIVGHAHLSTTADVYLIEDEAVVIRRVAEHLAQREERARQPAPPVAAGYHAADLAVLFGGLPQ